MLLRRTVPYAVPPGPNFKDVFLQRGNVLEMVGNVHKRFGQIAYIRMGADGAPIYFIFDPDAIEHVMVKNRDNYQKSRTLSRTDTLLGNGILLSEGDKWKRNRKLMAPAFHGRALAGYLEQMQAACDAEFSTWEAGTLIEDIHPRMMNLALDIAVGTLFGQDDVSDRSRAIIASSLKVTLDHFARTLQRPWRTPTWLPTPRIRRALAAVEALNEVVYGIIEGRRASGEERDDLLGMLLAARHDDGSGMTDLELRDEVMTLLLAGHETTAQALTFGAHLLGHYPDVQERVRAEAELPLETPKDLKAMTYTDACVSEILRMYPPAPMVGREAVEPDELLGYHIPAGAQVVMPIWYMHRSPALWDEPDRFNPDRWLQEGVPSHRFAFYPFGGGQRVCIAAAFARMELVVGLRSLVLHTSAFKSLGPVIPELTQSVTIRPTNAIPVLL